MYCGQCGAKLEDSVLKCPRCHTRAGKGKRFCQNCGYPRKPTDTGCQKCGAVFEEKAPSQPAKVPIKKKPEQIGQSIPSPASAEYKKTIPEQHLVQQKEKPEQPSAEKQKEQQAKQNAQPAKSEEQAPQPPVEKQQQALPPIMRKVLNNAEMLESLGNKHVRKMITHEDSITDPKDYLSLYEKTEKERKTNMQLSQELDKREKRRKELVQLRRTGQITEEQQKELDMLENNTNIEELKRQLQEQSNKGKWTINHSSDFQSSKPEKKKQRRFLNKKIKSKAPEKDSPQAEKDQNEKGNRKLHDVFQMTGFVLSICAMAGMFIPANVAPILMAVYAGISLILVLVGRRGQYKLLSHAAVGIDIFFAVAMAAPYILKRIEIS